MKSSFYLKSLLQLAATTVAVFLISGASAGERWTNEPDAVRVLGQLDFDSGAGDNTQTTMSGPWDVAVDPATGKVFVAELNNNRVLRFASFEDLENGAPAEIVLGQTDFTSTGGSAGIDKLWAPTGVVVDSGGRLWVSESGNHRVVRYDNASTIDTGADATSVLGQPDFDTRTPATSQTKLYNPRGMAIDEDGNLFVSTYVSNRVVMFADAASLANGAPASLVLGQEDFDSLGTRVDQDNMSQPSGVALDAEGNLYVAETGANRVVRFDNAAMKSNGDDADAVLGQPDFTSSDDAVTAEGMNSPYDVYVDPDGRLWVADYTNGRILGFSNAKDLPDGSAADIVVGQPDFETAVIETSITGTPRPSGICCDSTGRLYVSDFISNRVVIFEKTEFQPDFTIGESFSSQKGKNKYNSSGSGQKKSVKSVNKEIKFVAKIENDGTIPESFLLKSKGTTSKFRIRVFKKTGGTQNVTGAVKAGTHLYSDLGVGSSATYHLKVKPKSSIRKKRASINAWIQATSVVDGEKDRVVGKVKNRP